MKVYHYLINLPIIIWISLVLNGISLSAYFYLSNYLKGHPEAYDPGAAGRVCSEPAESVGLVNLFNFLLFILAEISSLIYAVFFVKKDGIKALLPFSINLISWLLILFLVVAITPNCS